MVTLLTRLNLEPNLRQAVQASLGFDGRRRVEEGIMRSLRNLPDAEQRARTLTLWSELEASAPPRK